MPAGWVERMVRRRRIRIAIGLLVLLLAALVLWREPISERLVPDAGLNRRLDLAQAALANGELTALDGSGARELFESVLATDPDQMLARRGLVDVRNAAMARAARALKMHRATQARRDIALARALSAPSVQLQPLVGRLRDLEASSGNVSVMLDRATSPGVDEESAFALYERVLQLDTRNARALEGRRMLLSRLLRRADALLDAGEVEAAHALVAEVIAVDPTHLDLPTVQARLGEDLARQQESSPVPAVSPASGGQGESAQQADRWIAYAEERIGASDYPEAERALTLARQLQPGHPKLAATASRLRRARGRPH